MRACLHRGRGGAEAARFRARDYTNHVTYERLLILGVALQIVGLLAFYQYVTSGPSSAVFIWLTSGTGLVLALIGLVTWCRRNMVTAKLIKLAGGLFGLGGITFGFAALGHTFGVFFVVAIPALLLSVAFASLAVIVAVVGRVRSHRRQHEA